MFPVTHSQILHMVTHGRVHCTADRLGESEARSSSGALWRVSIGLISKLIGLYNGQTNFDLRLITSELSTQKLLFIDVLSSQYSIVCLFMNTAINTARSKFVYFY